MAFLNTHPASSTPAPNGDVKVEISLAELARLVGMSQQQRLIGVFESSPPQSRVSTVTLRRVRASGGGMMIGFHTDVSYKTMQVPLNQQAEYRGGRVVYARPDGFVCPDRPPGSYTIHDARVLHGVTRLVSGERYSLFLQTTSEKEASGDASLALESMAVDCAAGRDREGQRERSLLEQEIVYGAGNGG